MQDSDKIYMIPYLFIREKTKMRQLPVDDILFFEAENAYTRIVTNKSNKSYLSSQNLGKIESKLCFPFFYRVHRSYIVNLNHVDAIAGKGLTIGQYYIPIGRNYRHIIDAFILI